MFENSAPKPRLIGSEEESVKDGHRIIHEWWEHQGKVLKRTTRRVPTEEHIKGLVADAVRKAGVTDAN